VQRASDQITPTDRAGEPKKIACHEVGHTVGLDHTSYDSCLRSNATTAPVEGYSDHDKNHMDSEY
jgi:predicted Zn-dependent protease